MRKSPSSVQTLWHLKEEPNGQTTLRASSWRIFPSLAMLFFWLLSLSGLILFALWLGRAMNAQPMGNLMAFALVLLGMVSIIVFVVHQVRSARIGTVMVIDSMRNTIHVGSVQISLSKVRAIALARVFYYRGSDIIEYPEIHVVHDDNGNLRRKAIVEMGSNCKKVVRRLAEVLHVPLIEEDYRVRRER
ncbi:MAG: hypothetical protein JNK16_05160 [Phycisphaerales bacterium]|nr:hypothetical protein [Phycisphaerales bacterium]